MIKRMAGVLALGALLSACVAKQEYLKVQDQLRTAQEELDKNKKA